MIRLCKASEAGVLNLASNVLNIEWFSMTIDTRNNQLNSILKQYVVWMQS